MEMHMFVCMEIPYTPYVLVYMIFYWCKCIGDIYVYIEMVGFCAQLANKEAFYIIRKAHQLQDTKYSNSLVLKEDADIKSHCLTRPWLCPVAECRFYLRESIETCN